MANDLYLQHYGVKGMKWGIRRYQNKDGTITNAGKRRARKDSSPESKIRQQRKADLKNRRSLSDADLDKRINRLKKEKQFKELVEEDIAPGRTAVKKFMKSTGGKILSSAALGTLAFAGKHFVANKGFSVDKINWQEAANYVFPNPNKKK